MGFVGLKSQEKQHMEKYSGFYKLGLVLIR